MDYTPKDIARFETFFQKDKGCWDWEGALGGGSYGSFSIKHKSIRAHRFAYAVYIGELDDDLVIMHTCDNRKCVNPSHLRQDTQKANIIDCVAKGRWVNNCGSKHGLSKLTEKDISEIRSLRKQGRKQQEIADIFDIDQGMVSNILLNKNWKHV